MFPSDLKEEDFERILEQDWVEQPAHVLYENAKSKILKEQSKLYDEYGIPYNGQQPRTNE